MSEQTAPKDEWTREWAVEEVMGHLYKAFPRGWQRRHVASGIVDALGVGRPAVERQVTDEMVECVLDHYQDGDVTDDDRMAMRAALEAALDVPTREGA